MSTGMQPVSTPSVSATADQILAAEQIHSIATRTTVAQREPLRTQIMDMQRRMGLSPSLSDGLIGRSTARAVFDITGRRIPNVVMAEASPVLSPPGAPAPAPVPGAPAAPHGGTAPVPGAPAAPHGGTAPAPGAPTAPHGGTAPTAPHGGAAPASVEPLQTSLASQVGEGASFFERYKTLLLVTGGLVVATGVAVYLMTSAEGEASAMDEATLRMAARQLGISRDSDVQSIRAAAARALQAYPDDEVRRNAIIEARDIMIRARSQGSPSGAASVSSRGRALSYEVTTARRGGR